MTPLMLGLALTAAGVTPTPTPQPAPVTGPGIVGFLVTFALVALCIPIFLSMARKIRGVRYRDGSDAPDRAEEVEGADGAEGADAVDGAGPGPRP